ncbi:hypothetical protein L0B53_00675 [Vibrio sp. SS-MA-C1-2]|uniref:hypothetical protein n=1 Tax=Vibrio sp. SS-MA-C1-2 TaxID=2908646 RepID=UPI001F3495C5|nr:hypothetical protein [Vibrio sp. SS-MA-C1-2]UJF17325.1 hypothetical protein L0B53_00675 [Vibrio sp. SS-MA-C1-2]
MIKINTNNVELSPSAERVIYKYYDELVNKELQLTDGFIVTVKLHRTTNVYEIKINTEVNAEYFEVFGQSIQFEQAVQFAFLSLEQDVIALESVV